MSNTKVDRFMKPIIIIPAYKPGRSLIEVVRALSQEGYIAIVVNDGSPQQYQPVFEQLQRTCEQVVLVKHLQNQGKGQALKTGFQTYLEQFPHHTTGVVTADCDGQHLPEDIIRVANALQSHSQSLWLGTRAFDDAVPLRSRLGNQLTRWVFRLFSGQDLQDTQTGLRGIPRHFLLDLLKTRSRRYDFELDMLLMAAKKMVIQECRIQTVYHNNNQSSHFNPLVDSFKIYFAFVRSFRL